MRSPDRIDDFLKTIGDYWKHVPDWRFEQLITNVLGTSKIDPFFLEEDAIKDLFKSYFKGDRYE